MKAQKLSDQEILKNLGRLNDWMIDEGMLHREFTFKNFRDAFAFMSKLALISEKLDHHANIFNCYNRVTVDLSTHEAGGITEKDFQWAELCDKAQ